MASESWHIEPSHGLGFISTDARSQRLRIADPYIALGAALQDILSTIEKDKTRFTDVHVNFSQTNPLSVPVVVTLPPQGLRLRFDGADQRLRLIEVTDLKKLALTHKGIDLVKPQELTSAAAAPHFKRIYTMFNASFPGEYMPPAAGQTHGTYVLSWPGVAFNFPLRHADYSPDKDHVSLLGSHAAGPATQMAIFEGRTWADARKDLFIREPNGPRSTASHRYEDLPAELELATIYPADIITFDRRGPATPFTITLNQTTPQDLITELGAPSTTYKPRLHDSPLTPAHPSHHRANSSSRPPASSRSHHPPSQPSSYSSTNTDTFETDFDPYSGTAAEDLSEDPLERATRDSYWCYFHHGLDILVGPPEPSQPLLAARSDLVVKRVVIQGNVPGSAAFNRHRRLRWNLVLPSSNHDSETPFPTILKPALLAAFPSAAADPQTSMGRVINRSWDDSMESSFYLPDQDRDTDGRSGEGGGEGGEEWLGNVRLFQFPGVLFEVLGCGAVGAVYCGK